MVSERAPEDYLSMLRDNGISYIVASESAVDLVKAANLLGEKFGICRLLLEGGGHINGAFLQADLVDEVSILLVPDIDSIDATRKAAVPLKLKSVDRRDRDTLWLRYEVVRS